MFCPKCGTHVPDAAAFCPKCGAAIDERPLVADRRKAEQGRHLMPKAIMSAAIAAVLSALLFMDGFMTTSGNTRITGMDDSITLLTLVQRLVTGDGMGAPTMVSISIGVGLFSTIAIAIMSWTIGCVCCVMHKTTRVPQVLGSLLATVVSMECLAYAGFAWWLTPWIAWNTSWQVMPAVSVEYPDLVWRLMLLAALVTVAAVLGRVPPAPPSQHANLFSFASSILLAVGVVSILGFLFVTPLAVSGLVSNAEGAVMMPTSELLSLLVITPEATVGIAPSSAWIAESGMSIGLLAAGIACKALSSRH